MGESLWLHERCLALQLLRDEPPPSRLPKPPRPSRQHLQQGTPTHSSSSPKRRHAETQYSNVNVPRSPSTDSDTPTPTNGLPDLPTSPVSNKTTSSALSHLNKYQDGYLLFQAWQAANTVCVWNTDLMSAVREAVYVGLLVGGILLVGGGSKVLATITHAWSRSLLVAPTGFTLTMLGEVSGCKMVAVPQGHFTPLADALCWVIHRLTENGGTADPEVLHSTLTASFPMLNTPDSTIIHATLSSLIHQRKVYHSGRSYGIVHPDTYQLTPVFEPSASPCPNEVPPVISYHGSSQSLLDPASHIISQGGAQLIVKNGICHAMVQTNLAELITGAILPTDKIISPKPQGSSRGVHPLERQTSHGMLLSHRNHSRSASLRLSPTKVAQLANTFSESSISTTICNTNVYEAHDMSDITIKAERGSVLTKLLRVSPRRRLASFSGQFPPPEWNDCNTSVIHLHSVAVQTSSRQRKDSNDILWSSLPSWAPRSSTLPRRLRRPLSCTPPLSQNSNPESPQLMQASSYHMFGSESVNPKCQSVLHGSPHMSVIHHPHLSCKGSLDRLQSEPSPYQFSENPFSHESYRHISRSDQNVDGKIQICTDSLGARYGPCPLSSNMVNRKQVIDRSHQHHSPEHHALASKSHLRSFKKPPTHQGRKFEEGITKRKEESNSKKLEENIRVKEYTCVHKQKSHLGTKEKHQKSHDNSCRHKSSERDKKKDQNQEDKHLQITDCDETPVRDQPSLSMNEKTSCEDERNISKQYETSDKGRRNGSPKTRKIEMCDSDDKEKGIIGTQTCSVPEEDLRRYNRSSLQLDLTTLHMNNSKKVVSSPHRPEGLKNNMLHDGKGVNEIAKGSSHEVNNCNLGYRDVDKCHKQPCSQTLDKAHQVHEPASEEQQLVASSEDQQAQNQVIKDESLKSKAKLHRSPKKKVLSSMCKDPNIVVEKNISSKDACDNSPNDSNVNPKKVSPDIEVASINTYPSLSELNLNFSSLAAQKILHGVSHNSIDTLVEVNLAAEKRKINVKRPDAVTNTDFGFL